MPLKIDSPLFSDAASGAIRGVGSFRTTPGGTFLVPSPGGNTTPNPAQQQQRNSFADAKAAHSKIVPSIVFAGGRYRKRRIPSWPDFWAQWLINNPGFSSRRAALDSPIGDFALDATADKLNSSWLVDGQIGDFGLAAVAIKVDSAWLVNGQVGDFGLASTAQQSQSAVLVNGQIGDFGLTATAQQSQSAVLANGQIGDFGLTATATVG